MVPSVVSCSSLLVIALLVSYGSCGIYPLLMNNVKPEQAETYFCRPARMDTSQEYYITGFVPNATMETAHHILVYGCEEPGMTQDELEKQKHKVWNCGHMSVAQSGIPSKPVCAKGSQIIYAWGKDAPQLTLPEGVAFKVGGKTSIKYLVLQVHYASVDKFTDGKTDDTGVFFEYTVTPQPKSAGVLLLGSGGRMNPHSVEYFETACTLTEDKDIHPFAFRAHTHSMGKLVTGYKVTGPADKMTWELIGKKNPQEPQYFYPVSNDLTLSKGDIVAARCTMNNTRDRVTKVGSTNEDEMCNFYIMYWSEGDPLDQKYCFTAGPPLYRWAMEFASVPRDASVLSPRDNYWPNLYYHHH